MTLGVVPEDLDQLDSPNFSFFTHFHLVIPTLVVRIGLLDQNKNFKSSGSRGLGE